MKITFVVPTLNLSGGLRVVSIYAKLLATKGHIVTVVSPKEKTATVKQRVKRALKWKGYQFKNKFDDTFFKNPEYQVLICKSESKVFNHDVPDADIVIATWWETAEWVNEFSGNKGKKVYFIQGYEVYEHLPKERVKTTYRYPFFKITIANWLVDIMKKDYSAVQVALVPNSVNQEAFDADGRVKQDRPTIGFLFSETELKGVTTALKVIENLKQRIPSLRVIAFGSHLPVTFSVPDYVELSISPKQEDIRLLYQQCDLWLCCSLIEGFGLTILEAMACRTPAVSTKCGGPEDIITEGKNGYLCDVDDVNALTVVSQRILGMSDKEWLVFSSHAYEYAQSYSWSDAAGIFEAALQEALCA